MQEFEPRRKATEYIRLHKGYTVIPLDDRNLGSELFMQKVSRKSNADDSEFITELRKLLEDAPISEFFKGQLSFESKLEASTGWTDWNESQEEIIKDLLGISLEENKYGIFDPNHGFNVEINYFKNILPLLQLREEKGLPNPVSWQEWAGYLKGTLV